MNFLFSPSHRNAGVRTFAAPFTAPAFTFFGVRISRDHILRLSAIVTLRTLLTLFDLPLEQTAAVYLGSLLSSVTNVTIFLALTSNYFHYEGFLGRIGAFLFPSSRKPSAFLTIYSRLVFVVGPIASWFESAVITYEVMRIARIWESHMQRAQAQGSSTSRRLLLMFTFLCLTVAASIGVYVFSYEPQYAGTALTIIVLVLSYSFFNDDANVVEAAMLSVYASVVMLFGWLEAQRLADETRAMLLMVTVVLLFVAMSRATRFVRLMMIGFDAFCEEERAGVKWGHGSVRRAFGVCTIVALTFRTLVWCDDVKPGEYFPLLCRGVQVAAVLFLYVLYSQR